VPEISENEGKKSVILYQTSLWSQGNCMSAYSLNSTFDLQEKEQEIILAMKIQRTTTAR
jgi:hypothetical protein